MAEELLLTRYERGWNLHDHLDCAECFLPDGIREYRVRSSCGEPDDGPRIVRGRDAIARDIGMLMEAVPDLSIEIVSAGYGSDRRVWTEWLVRGTHSADLGWWRGRGRRIEVLGVSVFRLSNEGFAEERLYWDSAFTRGMRAGRPAV